MSPRLIAVAVPVPFLDLLTYGLPDTIDVPLVGARVRVPLGPRTVTGCVVATEGVHGPAVGIRDVVSVLDEAPFLPPVVVALCQWVAEYYMAGIGDAIGVAMPPGTQRRASSYKMRRLISATMQGVEVVGMDNQTDGPASGLGPKQTAALQALVDAPAGLPAAVLRERGIGGDVVARLVRRGLATIRSEVDDRDPFERFAALAETPERARTLTDEQAHALAACRTLADAQAFRTVVLHGVTGSGKTEIYLRLAEHVRQSGRRALVLVPEIALTPSAAAQFRGAFGSRVAIQHSGLSDGERHDQWQRIRRGDVDVVIGTRSAVFAPIERLGLIIVDEEHDGSYKQEESPRYHGRDVAIVRASREGALVVLGSATPSLESYQHAVAGKYTHLSLERRVLDRPMAAVRVVNIRDEMAEQGPDVVISRELAAAIGDRLTRREQVLVLLNRRGFSTAVFCRQCGDAFECPNCSVSLTVHGSRQKSSVRHPSRAPRQPSWHARCHYCNYSVTVPGECRKCAAPYLEQRGFGTEKVEQQIQALFPSARVARLDRDTVRRRGALTDMLTRFGAGHLDVLVGTQMIAKGHDFPRVTLVGVVSADVGLGLADFRASERTFQLLTQVAGRAGRGDQPGEAIIQTLFPEHYSIQSARRQDYGEFFEREAGYRKAMRYPPFWALINVIVRGRTFTEAFSSAQDLVRRVTPGAAARQFIVLGPAPAPLERLRGEHRVQFFLKGTRRAAMREALQAALAEMPDARKRITVDVDPLSVL